MPNTLLIRDETFQGICLQERQLTMEAEWVSVREIVAARVIQEVEAYNQKVTSTLSSFIQRRSAERLLKEEGRKEKKREVDAEKQVYIALEAFYGNGYFVLINSVQAESLDQLVQINPQTVVSFLQLAPLVGA